MINTYAVCNVLIPEQIALDSVITKYLDQELDRTETLTISASLKERSYEEIASSSVSDLPMRNNYVRPAYSFRQRDAGSTKNKRRRQTNHCITTGKNSTSKDAEV